MGVGESVELARYAMSNLEDQTHFTKNLVPDCTGNTDIVWHKFNNPNPRGQYICVDASGTSSQNQCQKAKVLLNPDQLNDDVNREKTACHEVGHSGGLSHADDANDCMKNGAVSSDHRDYNNHHIDHLNDN